MNVFVFHAYDWLFGLYLNFSQYKHHRNWFETMIADYFFFFFVFSCIYWKTQVSIIKTDRQWIDWYLLRIWCEFRNEWKFFEFIQFVMLWWKSLDVYGVHAPFVRVYAYVIRFIPFDQFGCFVSHRCKRKWAFLDNKTHRGYSSNFMAVISWAVLCSFNEPRWFKKKIFCFGVCFGKWFSLHNKPAIQLYRKHSSINVNDTYAYMHIHTRTHTTAHANILI